MGMDMGMVMDRGSAMGCGDLQLEGGVYVCRWGVHGGWKWTDGWTVTYTYLPSYLLCFTFYPSFYFYLYLHFRSFFLLLMGLSSALIFLLCVRLGPTDIHFLSLSHLVLSSF